MLRKRSTLFFLVLLLGLVLGASFVFALEINYPNLPGTDTTRPQDIPSDSPNALPLYVQYIVNFAVWAAAIVALVVLVIGGVRYSSSTGKPEAMISARNQISAGFFGLLLDGFEANERGRGRCVE